jgi:hypothetical protein
MTTERNVQLDPLSVTSLLITLRLRGSDVGAATGFVVQLDGRSFLITNRHVCTGTDETGKSVFATSAAHDELIIHHHVMGHLGQWCQKPFPLYNLDGSHRWIEHPLGSVIDVVALPLDPLPQDVQLYPLDLRLAETDLIPQPGMTSFIIGFPFGKTSGGCLPIWKTGHVASDPDINFESKPILLIDATTRSGMSGAPVVIRSTGGYKTRGGSFVMGGFATLLLGVYSGRLHESLEIGIVWKPHMINEILAQTVTPSIIVGSA